MAPDGTWIEPHGYYWTLVTDQIPIPDGQQRVDETPGLTVMHEGTVVPTITRDATVEGEDWMERLWPCHLAELEILAIGEGSRFLVTAASDDATGIDMRFHFINPDGLESAYGPDPHWISEGHTLRGQLPSMQEGRYDVFVSVSYPDGSSRMHQFQAESRPKA